MSNQSLLDKLDRTTEVLSQTLSQLVKLSSIDHSRLEGADSNEHEDNEDSVATIATTGVMLVHSHTLQLIKGVQDLLVITRSIREKWVLGQVTNEEQDRRQTLDYEKCEQMLSTAIDKIFNPGFL
ncbi:HDL066Cp [Eremothecium sinecaudum]|uniref:Mediator of RNA polymerase II transcription subunit 22 n=1 Tax=Eremothecium sinecaudum TaxID=45286 RepID=A0A0X8HSN6_9SACH|nr:HDL066Cp [Eremothecium sinecaudum]AMD20678.1 HDL066Cp [Eremothecium sinecaudum]